jgi:hypothetical protein
MIEHFGARAAPIACFSHAGRRPRDTRRVGAARWRPRERLRCPRSAIPGRRDAFLRRRSRGRGSRYRPARADPRSPMPHRGGRERGRAPRACSLRGPDLRGCPGRPSARSNACVARARVSALCGRPSKNRRRLTTIEWPTLVRKPETCEGNGGKVSERRTLEYRVGDEPVVPGPVEVGDFYGMATS